MIDKYESFEDFMKRHGSEDGTAGDIPNLIYWSSVFTYEKKLNWRRSVLRIRKIMAGYKEVGKKEAHKKEIMTTDVLQITLLGLGEGKYFSYPDKLPPESVNKVLNDLGIDIDISEDWNGCDLDWSLIDNFKFAGKEFMVWGSGFSGSLMFERQK